MQHAKAFHSFSDACERFVSSIATHRSLSNDEAEVIAFYCKGILGRSNHVCISIPGTFQTEPRKEVARRLHKYSLEWLEEQCGGVQAWSSGLLML